MELYLSLKDHVYKYISEKINDGTLVAGDKISEIHISEELHVSRTPVREALMQLASDGYLENLPRKGFRVQSLDSYKVQELYETIGTLDGRAAYIAMNFVTEEVLRKMQFLAESMDSAIRAGLYNKYYELQMEFHNSYLDLCPNKVMTATLAKLKNSFIRKYYVFENPKVEFEILCQTNSQHYEIIRLLREKNGEALEHYIRDVHWNSRLAEFESFPQK